MKQDHKCHLVLLDYKKEETNNLTIQAKLLWSSKTWLWSTARHVLLT